LEANFCFSDPLSLVRDHRAKEVLTAQGIVVHSFNADLLYEPWDVNDAHGRPFTTFADFWERCLSMPYDPEAPLLPPKRIVSGLYSCNSVPELSSLNFFILIFNILMKSFIG
jgi:cryptochrome 1